MGCEFPVRRIRSRLYQCLRGHSLTSDTAEVETIEAVANGVTGSLASKAESQSGGPDRRVPKDYEPPARLKGQRSTCGLAIINQKIARIAPNAGNPKANHQRKS